MLDKINTTIDIFEKAVITIGMAAGTLLLFTNVVLRYLFDSGITWVLEAVQYTFAWVVLIGAAHGVKAGIHLGIDILVEKFSRETQRIISLVAAALSLIFVATVFVLSIQYRTLLFSWSACGPNVLLWHGRRLSRPTVCSMIVLSVRWLLIFPLTAPGYYKFMALVKPKPTSMVRRFWL